MIHTAFRNLFAIDTVQVASDFPIFRLPLIISKPFRRLILTPWESFIAEESLKVMLLATFFDLIAFLLRDRRFFISLVAALIILLVKGDDLVHHLWEELFVFLRSLIIDYPTFVLNIDHRFLVNKSIQIVLLLLNNFERPNTVAGIFSIPPLKVVWHRRNGHVGWILHLVSIYICRKPIIVLVVLNIGGIEIILYGLTHIPLDKLRVWLRVAHISVSFVTKVWRALWR